ncbi:threonyl-tRNA synthetase [Parcubacteria bacterium DG_74_2]|nr:MAG: threonyl-tRNA synthetase [Parcubacteria bacterium DG_74_2]
MAKIKTIRHSLSHILAAAVQEIFPGTKFGIGPAIENGFYYDFDLPRALTLENLPRIEEKMKNLIRQNIVFKKRVISKKEARKIFKDQSYKLELIGELPGKKATIYQSENFVDLCKGPHLKSTGQINPDSFKLTKIAGAYWRGSEKNPMLTRIYGVAFKTKRELENHLKIQEEAEKRDHRILGQKLELFMFDEEIGAGLPIWLPKGTILRKSIEDYLYEELTSQGYQWVVSFHIGKLDIWKTSGHWELYRENMYSPIKIDKEEYLLRPMNCPFHVKIYKSKIRSYKDLPIKYAEFGTVYRYEKSGVLHGLTRVRGFTQDDAHIWCTPEQLSGELTKLLKHGLKIFRTFGFKEFEIYLSTRPEKYAGTEKGWQKATSSLKYVLKKLKIKYQIDPGGGVFYGPKIDIKIKDSLGRPWQCTTIQVDFNLPERFEIIYIDKKGKKRQPIMIHRALIGSLERFIGVLLENYAGALPFWLSPEQIWILPIGSKHKKYAQKISKILKEEDFRTEIKDEAETVSKKVREGEIQKIPYLLVVGNKEMKGKSVRVRKRGKGDIGEMKLENFIKKIKKEIYGLGKRKKVG